MHNFKAAKGRGRDEMRFHQILFHMLKKGEITPKKAYYFINNFINYKLNWKTAVGYPSILMVEPTNLCNLKCPLCPTGNGSLTAPRGFMAFEDFKKIIDETGKYLLNLTLWNYGEPFLNKDIYKMIKYAREKNIFVRISTNGHFFQKEENIQSLLESDLDYLIVSLDGASQETFSKYRKNGNFEKVIENIHKISEERKRQNRKSPHIEIQFIIMKHNEHEVQKMKELAKTLNVDRVKLKTVNIEMDLSKDVKETMKEYLPKSENLSRYKKNGNTLKRKGMKQSCKRLWLSSVINWDGSVVPCCYDPNRRHELGNCLELGFKVVWNNQKYANFRTAIMQNKAAIEMCRNCTGNLMDLDVEVDQK